MQTNNNTQACLTNRQINLLNQLRQLWEQHIHWTRSFIISTAANLGDLEPVTNRLLQNPGDFAKIFHFFYGPEIAAEFQELFKQHLLIAADLVNAAKKSDTKAAQDARKKWYSNADDISSFLSRINPYWNEATWKKFFYDHLAMTEKEALLRLQGKYAEDVAIYDQIQNGAMQKAEFMLWGLLNPFNYN
ncbi:MAG: acetylglutamate kinase [Lachnospiraceae bacterium]